MSAQQYWDKVYSEEPFKSGKIPLPFLTEMFPRLQKGKVLDIGMGEGANAVYLAQKGMTVKGFDASKVAIDHALNLAKETGVQLEAKVLDLDLFLMGLMEYDTIIMTFFKPSLIRYYSEIMRGLKQGGTFLVHSFSADEMEESLGPEDAFKNFYFRSNEILQQLKGMRILFYNEGRVNGRHVVQCLAQKPFDKDASKYNLFDMQSQQSSPQKSNQHSLAEALFKKK